MKRLLSARAVITGAGAIGTAVLIEDGLIAAIGPKEDLRRRGIEELSFDGIITAGLTDSHIHLAGWAASKGGLDLGGATTFGEVREQVRRHGGTLIAGSPVIGNRLDDTKLAEGRLPTRHELDRMLEARPILLYRHCSHIAVANTAALELAGVGPETPDPAGGSLDRTSSGEPTGVLREGAVALVSSALDPLIRSPLPEQLVEAANRLLRIGILEVDCIVSAGTPMWCGSGNELEDLLVVAGDLPIDVNVFVITHSASELRTASERIRHVGGRLRFGGWKGFADGSLGGRTAALIDGYSDGDDLGMLVLDPDRDLEMASVALDLGGKAAIHAIGDLANHATIALFDQLASRDHDPSNMRIEHASVLDPGSIEDMARIGVVASVQPPFIPSDAAWIGSRLSTRACFAYPLQSLSRAGVSLIGGSDAPVENPNPWEGMAAARAHVINPSEAVDPLAALDLYTRTPLAAGGRADLLVIDRDPTKTHRIEDTRVMAVWKDGRRRR